MTSVTVLGEVKLFALTPRTRRAWAASSAWNRTRSRPSCSTGLTAPEGQIIQERL